MITYRISSQAEIDVQGVPHQEWHRDLEKSLEEETRFGIRTLSIMGAFLFGTIAKMQERISRLIGTKVVNINLLDVPFMDLSGVFALGEMIDRLKFENIKPIVVVKENVGIRQQMIDMGYGARSVPTVSTPTVMMLCIWWGSILKKTQRRHPGKTWGAPL